MTEKQKSHPKQKTKAESRTPTKMPRGLRESVVDNRKLSVLRKEIMESPLEQKRQRLLKQLHEISIDFGLTCHQKNPEMWKLRFEKNELNISLTEENLISVARLSHRIFKILSESPDRAKGCFAVTEVFDGHAIELKHDSLFKKNITYITEHLFTKTLQFNPTDKVDHRNQSLIAIMQAFAGWLNSVKGIRA